MKLRTGKLVAHTYSIAELSVTDKNQIWNIFQNYYEAVEKERFEQDLNGKHHVILLRDTGDQSIQGFSTLQVLKENVLGKRVVAIFSGDTIIDNKYWGQTALQKEFFRYILKVKLLNPIVPVYWFLISKGYKTYLLLSRNFYEYWPRFDRKTPHWPQAVLSTFSRKKYPSEWCEEKGLLQFSKCCCRLKNGVANIEPSLLQAPDIRFFVEKNPDHVNGSELCCLGKVDSLLAIHYSTKLLKKTIFKKKKIKNNCKIVTTIGRQ